LIKKKSKKDKIVKQNNWDNPIDSNKKE
jgi:hypothetical protein